MARPVRHGDPRKDMFFKLDPLILDWATGEPVLFAQDASKLKEKVSVLRKYQETRDERREDHLMHELRRGIAQTLLASKNRDYNVQWEPIHQSGVSEIVLEITARQLGHSGTRLSEQDGPPHHSVSTLTLCLFGYAQAVNLSKDRYLGAAQALLDKTVKLFSSIWEKREQWLIPRSAVPHLVMQGPVDFMMHVMRLACVIVTLHYFCTANWGPGIKVAPPFLKVMLYCWIHTHDFVESNHGLSVFRWVLVNDSRNLAKYEDLFDDVIVKTNSQDALVAKMSCLLAIETYISFNLVTLFELFSRFVEYCPAFLLDVSGPVFSEFLLRWSAACQRQLCSGVQTLKELSTANWTAAYNNNLTAEVLQSALGSLKFILTLATMPKADPLFQQLVWMVLSENCGSMKLIQLVAFGIRIPSEDMTKELLDGLRTPILQCIRFMYPLRTSERVQEEIIKATRSVWYPTQQRLRTIPKRQDRKFSSTLTQLTEAWNDLGAACKLNPFDASIQDPGLAGSVVFKPNAPWWQVRGCNWKQCLCSVAPALGHRPKLCTGCWRALYCSPRCQALDWREGGHRAVCRSST